MEDWAQSWYFTFCGDGDNTWLCCLFLEEMEDVSDYCVFGSPSNISDEPSLRKLLPGFIC